MQSLELTLNITKVLYFCNETTAIKFKTVLMKKLLFLTFIVSLVFIGCSKDDKGPDLAGTFWEETSGREGYFTLKFTTDRDGEFTLNYEQNPISYGFIYEYSKGKINLYPKITEYPLMTGVVEGNTFNIVNVNGKPMYTLTKK